MFFSFGEFGLYRERRVVLHGDCCEQPYCAEQGLGQQIGSGNPSALAKVGA